MIDTLIQHSALGGLFLSALISATLFPGGSEWVLALLARQGEHPPGLLLAVATAGNTLGGMSTWLIGRWAAGRRAGHPARAPREHLALTRLQRWGSPLLLLSWLPVLGDALCLASGWLRIGFVPALLFIGTGKALRYAFVIYFAG